MLLCQQSTLGQQWTEKAFSILFKMNDLFEKYIATLLNINLDDLIVHSQHSRYKLLVNERKNT